MKIATILLLLCPFIYTCAVSYYKIKEPKIVRQPYRVVEYKDTVVYKHDTVIKYIDRYKQNDFKAPIETVNMY